MSGRYESSNLILFLAMFTDRYLSLNVTSVLNHPFLPSSVFVGFVDSSAGYSIYRLSVSMAWVKVVRTTDE